MSEEEICQKSVTKLAVAGGLMLNWILPTRKSRDHSMRRNGRGRANSQLHQRSTPQLAKAESPLASQTILAAEKEIEKTGDLTIGIAKHLFAAGVVQSLPR